MKIQVICIGKSGKEFLVDGEREYIQRLGHYVPVEKIEIPDLKKAKSLSEEQVKDAEGKLLLSKTESNDTVILLDENGKSFKSREFAKYLEAKFNMGGKKIIFLIGGAYGFSSEVYERANGKISISKMTFSHQMIRMIFFEQLYRAMTILRGEPYHHD